MRKIKDEYEIDLQETFNIIIENKLKIFSLTFLFLIIALVYIVYRPVEKTTYFTETPIKPVSIFEESKYNSYNQYVGLNFNKKDSELLDLFQNLNSQNLIQSNKINSDVNIINSNFLYKLYISFLQEKLILKEAVIKLNLINKEDYLDDVSFIKAVEKLANSIVMLKKKEDIHWVLRSEVDNKVEWKNTLVYLNEFINNKVKQYIKANFDENMLNYEIFKTFQIEDINIQISSIITDDLIKKQLELKKINLENNKIYSRLKKFFDNTPVVNSSNFNAAIMKIELTKFKTINQTFSSTKILIVAGLVGLLFSVFYILIFERNRK